MNQPKSLLKSQKEEKVIKWIRDRVDYSRETERKPYSFYRGASFSDCLLPSIAEMQYKLRNLYIQTVVDEDMKSDLEDSQSINWSNRAVKLLPVRVPKDGNCLLHAASMAVWGVEDSQNILRDLMLMTAQITMTFKKRWWSQLMKNLHLLQITQHEIVDQEWNDVIRSISDLGSSSLSVAVPHRFLEGIHIYILANILRRPIIVVTDGHAKSLAGIELQENHIGGLYLPLEWPSIECCKTPIILGYSFSHFCPLLSETQPHFLVSQKKRDTPLVFPLVHIDLSCLVARYLKEEEDPIAWDLVQSYLLVTEMDVVEETGTVTKAPFAQLHLEPLKSDQNSLFEHLDLLKTKFIENEFQKAFKSQPYPTLEPGQQSSHPFYDIEMNSQTEVVKVNTLKDKTTNPQEKPKKTMPSHKYIQEANQNATNKCIFEGCSNAGHPNLQNFCQNCIRTLSTAVVSVPSVDRLMLSPVKITVPPKENMLSKMIKETAVSGNEIHTVIPTTVGGNEIHTVIPTTVGGNEIHTVIPTTVSGNEIHTVIPTAPLMSLEPQSQNGQLLSMMADRCINKCGYRCSKKTYPYCHECYQIENMREKQLLEQINATVSSSYEMTGKGALEPSCESLLKGDKETGDPKKVDIGYMLHTAFLSSQPSTFSSNNNSSLHAAGSENSLSENEGAANISPILRVTSDKDSKILLEIRADENKNIENYSEQKMLGDFPLNLHPSHAADKKSAQISNTQSGGKQDRVKESPTVNHDEQKYKSNLSQSIEGFAESFAETDLQSIIVGDIEVSEEPEYKVKCLSPYCKDYISSQQKLCDKCKDILKKSSQQNQKSDHMAINRAIEDQLEKLNLLQKEKTKPRLDLKRLDSVSRGKPCAMKSCPNYGDPQMNNMCSLCYFKSNPTAKPHRTVETGKKTDKIRSYSAHAVTEQMPYKEVGQPKGEYSHYTQKTQSASPVHRKCLPNYKSTEVHLNKERTYIYPPLPVYPHRYQFIETSGPESTIPSQPHSSSGESEPNSLIVTSMTERKAHKNPHHLPPDSSYSFNQNADTDFDKMFGSIEKTLKSTAKKCLSLKCDNYGNKATRGYCNSCFKVIRRQRIIERELQRGFDVPDGEVLQDI